MALNQDLIRERAYMLWLESGGGIGQCDDHWLRAEREIATTPSAPAPKKPAAAPKKAVAPKSKTVAAAAPAKPRTARRSSATA